MKSSIVQFSPSCVRVALLALLAGAAQLAHADVFSVRYESEAAGKQTTSATFSSVGVETFETLSTGSGKTYTSNFGTGGAITGTYKNLQVNKADQFGAAGGTGRYAVTFSTTGYSLDLSTTIAGGVNYFGFWLSALDANNYVTFYRGSQVLLEFSPANLLAMVKNQPAYYGNPNSSFLGQNKGEPYAFVNFFNETSYFDRVVFRQAKTSGGYESDNHTVGRWKTQGTGTLVPNPTQVSAVPEPTEMSLFALGLGLIGWRARRQRRAAAAA